jgi:hypothetical protein
MIKNFTIKLPYKERTGALGLLERNERADIQNERAVAAKMTILPPNTTVPSIPSFWKTPLRSSNKITRKLIAQKMENDCLAISLGIILLWPVCFPVNFVKDAAQGEQR